MFELKTQNPPKICFSKSQTDTVLLNFVTTAISECLYLSKIHTLESIPQCGRIEALWG